MAASMLLRVVILVAFASFIGCASSEKCEPLLVTNFVDNYISNKYNENPSKFCLSATVREACGPALAPITTSFGCGYEECKNAFTERVITKCGVQGLRKKYAERYFDFKVGQTHSNPGCATALHTYIALDIENSVGKTVDVRTFCNHIKLSHYCGGDADDSQRSVRVGLVAMGCKMSDCANMFYEQVMRVCGRWGEDTDISSSAKQEASKGDCGEYLTAILYSWAGTPGLQSVCETNLLESACGETGSPRSAAIADIGCSPEECKSGYDAMVKKYCPRHHPPSPVSKEAPDFTEAHQKRMTPLASLKKKGSSKSAANVSPLASLKKKGSSKSAANVSPPLDDGEADDTGEV